MLDVLIQQSFLMWKSKTAVSYRGVCAVDRVSFAIEPGQLVGVIGPNGLAKARWSKPCWILIEPKRCSEVSLPPFETAAATGGVRAAAHAN